MSVLETTVANGFCCGCGVCAGVCPTRDLEMQWNQYGEYNPVELHACEHECGLCVTVCPFQDGNQNEDDLGRKRFSTIPNIRHRSETGYYLSAGAGAVSDLQHRMVAASGGLATWFLEELLRRNIVDEVISVGHADDRKRLFRFYASTTPDEVRRGVGSAYYPVEISEMLHKMLQEEKRYAVIGLPCVLKGLRLAEDRIPKLSRRIVLMIGLACNHLTSTKFTEYAAYRAHLTEDIAFVSYRCKSLTHPRFFFKFRFVGASGTRAEQKWNGDVQLEQMFASRFCSLSACECCDDMHAEVADVTFMDAWLPEFAAELRGTSLWIARSPLVEQIFAEGNLAGDLHVDPIPIERVIAAQGTIRWKREMLSYRLHLMQEQNQHPPKKRVSAGVGDQITGMERDECHICFRIQQESREKTRYGYEGVGEWFDAIYTKRAIPVRLFRLARSGCGKGRYAAAYVWKKVSGKQR